MKIAEDIEKTFQGAEGVTKELKAKQGVYQNNSTPLTLIQERS